MTLSVRRSKLIFYDILYFITDRYSECFSRKNEKFILKLKKDATKITIFLQKATTTTQKRREKKRKS